VGYVRDGAHAAAIPDDVKERVDGLKDAVVRGTIHVPAE
jgi:hypothetical protein